MRDLPYMAVIRGLLELARDHLRYAMRASLACVVLAHTAVGGLIMGGLITAHPCHRPRPLDRGIFKVHTAGERVDGF